MGSLPQNDGQFTTLADLPKLHVIAERNALDLVARHRLYGSGIAYIDTHLQAATYSRPDCLLWTRDQRLRDVDQKLAIVLHRANSCNQLKGHA